MIGFEEIGHERWAMVDHSTGERVGTMVRRDRELTSELRSGAPINWHGFAVDGMDGNATAWMKSWRGDTAQAPLRR